MAFKLLTPLSQIERETNTFVQQGQVDIANELCKVGEQCVEIAKNLPQGGLRAPYPAPYQYLGKTQPNYTDWTSNLRNSIGWAVLKDGLVFKKNVGSIQNTSNYLNDLVSEYQTGIVLLVMATGQNPKNGDAYAFYVQALGYDVLKTSQLRGEDIVNQTLQKLFSSAQN